MSAASVVWWARTPIDIVTYVTLPLAFGVFGTFLWTRVPGNPIGPILLVAAVGFAALIGSGAWLVANVQLPSKDPVAIAVGLVANLAFVPSLAAVIVGVPLLFPDGHFLTPRWPWVAVAIAITVVAAEVRSLLGTDELLEIPGLRNPFYVPDLHPIFAITEVIETLFAIPLFALAIASLVLRYRRSDDVARH